MPSFSTEQKGLLLALASAVLYTPTEVGAVLVLAPLPTSKLSCGLMLTHYRPQTT